jgi:hypothetical protein
MLASTRDPAGQAAPSWIRLLTGAAGILFAGLWFGGLGVSGGYPEVTTSDAAYYAQTATRYWAGDHLLRLSILCLIIFLGGLWFAMRRHESGTGWLSAVALGSGLLVSGLQLVVLAFPDAAREMGACAGGAPPVGGCPLEPRVDAYVFSVLYGLANSLTVLALTPLALFFGATAAIAIARRALPAWLGWATAVIALIVLVSSVIETVFPSYLLFGLWVALTGVVIARARAESQRPGGGPTTKPLSRPDDLVHPTNSLSEVQDS